MLGSFKINKSDTNISKHTKQTRLHSDRGKPIQPRHLKNFGTHNAPIMVDDDDEYAFKEEEEEGEENNYEGGGDEEN